MSPARTAFRFIGILVSIVAAFLVVPLVVALLENEVAARNAFLVTMAGSAVIGGVFSIVFRSRMSDSVRPRDGFLLVASAWVIVAAVGAVPFVLSGTIPRYVDAFFESMSGFTTTGASILSEIESLPRSILMWRSLTHWLGGMGIIVLTVAVFPVFGRGGLQLMRAEVPGPSLDKITPKLAETAKIFWLIYVGMTVAQTALLMIGGMDLFDALTHTFGTLATGGFSPRNASVGHYNSAFIDIVITVFMIMAGTNFVLYHRALTGRFRELGRNTEFKVYLAVFGVATIAIALSLFTSGTYRTPGESLRYAGFQSASILTTTGYATADFDLWPAFARAVLFLLMFVGGCAGSTGGGIKVVRHVTLIKQAIAEMRIFLHPRSVSHIRLNDGVVRKEIVFTKLGFVVLYLGMVMLTFLVVSTAGLDLTSAFTTALVTVGNIGPGFGAIGPTMNYGSFPDYVKWFLCFSMMTGRLEVYTVLILFHPRFWRS